jgi:hypothetical protein
MAVSSASNAAIDDIEDAEAQDFSVGIFGILTSNYLVGWRSRPATALSVKFIFPDGVAINAESEGGYWKWS